ncbi:DNA-binding forkhead transcription factor for ribosomal proteins Fhl1 [Schizosaccharomyces pombe]|uniref:Fork head transcription factor 1 n=1 Tax=Schizosaccharomyces pombe (strain 972 / ATCC 24843) TaxID=284812 RepID=FKHL1_SCHPO|nr:fork head transcription factor Fhl1 [Schizosaccharomyces pombe]O14270.2 RecName: Full=Fork head transcription factor 1 [Schizosaccharomyces pombe 972h-]CAB77015.1 fork head transcription factor Fhl1 [Schizosaccharomyces pombe]|eukprot:NP_594272.1 fork head transcription factor Fhl1 [Schizosaccharomyces pombe]
MPVAEIKNATQQPSSTNRVQAYAKLEFEKFSFFVQTLQVTMGRKASNSSDCDVHLGDTKAISRQHAKIFYSFPNQRFEISVMGKNGAFVDGEFVERGKSVPLRSGTRVQIGQISFSFLLPEGSEEDGHLKETGITPLSLQQGKIAYSDEFGGKPTGSFHTVTSNQEKDLLFSHIKHESDLPLGLSPADTNISNATSIIEHPDAANAHTLASLNQPPKHLTVSPSSIQRLSPQPYVRPTSDERPIETDSSVSAPKVANHDEELKQGKSTSPSDTVLHPDLNGSPDTGDATQKPNLSYANLIARTLIANPNKKMTLGDICEWIANNWSYYRHQPPAWHNSIRHNLSLNKAFIRIPRRQNEPGKGSFWMLDPSYIDQFEGNFFRRTKKPTPSATPAAHPDTARENELAAIQTKGISAGKTEQLNPQKETSRSKTHTSRGENVEDRPQSLLQNGIQPIIMRDGKLALNPEFFKNANGEQQAPNEQAVQAISLLQQHINKQLGPAAANNPEQATAIANALAVALAQKLQKQQTQMQGPQQVQQQAKRRKAYTSQQLNPAPTAMPHPNITSPSPSISVTQRPAVNVGPPPYVRPSAPSKLPDTRQSIGDPLPPGAMANVSAGPSSVRSSSYNSTASESKSEITSHQNLHTIPINKPFTSDRPLYSSPNDTLERVETGNQGQRMNSIGNASSFSKRDIMENENGSFDTNAKNGNNVDDSSSVRGMNLPSNSSDALRGVKRPLDETSSSYT